MEKEKQSQLQAFIGAEDTTMDGKNIKLYANIGNVSDVSSALQNDAKGIGLFRTKFLFLERTEYPSEEIQYAAYKAVAEQMKGKKVIIRTLDIGADKQVNYIQLDLEKNPAMGYRAIRISLDQPNLFKCQLRAIYRASIYGNISVMYPMITSVSEVKKIKEIVREVKMELEEENIPYGDVKQGIMIETPAAVLISDLLAKEVDFFSIGTNDLTQYTLAIDRQNYRLDHLYDTRHEAILRMISMVVKNGHDNECEVGICGELAADVTMLEYFLKLGIDELSVVPNMILKLREQIRKIDTRKS